MFLLCVSYLEIYRVSGPTAWPLAGNAVMRWSA